MDTEIDKALESFFNDARYDYWQSCAENVHRTMGLDDARSDMLYHIGSIRQRDFGFTLKLKCDCEIYIELEHSGDANVVLVEIIKDTRWPQQSQNVVREIRKRVPLKQDDEQELLNWAARLLVG